ncbi:NADP-dependent oxidoreductase [Kineococcus sp. NUM-3379]
MKALVLNGFGGNEQFSTAEVPTPTAGPGQVRVRVAAVGVNPVDFKIRNGWLRDVVPTRFPAVLGTEVAGTVDQVGPGVDDLAVGDRVAGFADSGAYAGSTVTRATGVVRIPDELTFEQAAALPVGVETALRTLAVLAPQRGQTVVVNGAAGAVGSAAVQLLVRDGVHVVGTASEPNHDYLRTLGAVPVTYGDGVLDRIRAAAPRGVDAILDTAGRGFAASVVPLVGDPGRIVTTSDFEAAALGVRIAPGNLADLTAAPLLPVLELARKGEFTIPVARLFEFEEIPAALDVSERGHLRGKLVAAGPLS